MRNLPIILLVLSALASRAQLKEFYVTCDPADFQLIYDNYEEDIYIPINLLHNGVSYPSAEMRIRGDGSRVYPKKSLKVKLNGVFEDGRTALNLNAEWEDQSYVQQFIATELMKASGQACFNTEHAKLFINGVCHGLYLLVEPVDAHFLEVRNFNPNGTLYKATLDGSCLSFYDNVHWHWEHKEGPNLYRHDLQALIEELDSVPDPDFLNYVEDRFNYDEMVNMLAMNTLIAHGSTYYHNYFMFHDVDAEKWTMIPWDMDKTLLYYGAGFPYHRSTVFWEPDNPYHERAILIQQIRADLQSRINQLGQSIFNLAWIGPKLDSVQAVISQAVHDDINDDVSDTLLWQGKINTYKNRVSSRIPYLNSEMDNAPLPFRIERILNAQPGEQITINWDATTTPNGDPIQYRFGFNDDEWILNNAIIDSILSSTSFTFNLPAEEGYFYYTVTAQANGYEVYAFDSYNRIEVGMEHPEVVINEIFYDAGPAYLSEDWVEIHNPGSEAIDMGGWHMRDGADGHDYEFPGGTIINPGDFLIIARDTTAFDLYNSQMERLGPFNFGFGNGGDAVRIFDQDGRLVDDVEYEVVAPWPDSAVGTGRTIELLSPELDNMLGENWRAWPGNGTPGTTNHVLSTGQFSDGLELLSGPYPNPIMQDGSIVIRGSTNCNGNFQYKVINALGQTIFTGARTIKARESKVVQISTDLGSPGVYQFVVDGPCGTESLSFIVAQ